MTLSESNEQQLFVSIVRTLEAVYSRLYPETVNPFGMLHAIPNGGARSKISGAIMKREGVLAGMPDLFLPYPDEGCHGLYIEMKKTKKGKLSDAQNRVGEELERRGYPVVTCYGWKEAFCKLLLHISVTGNVKNCIIEAVTMRKIPHICLELATDDSF